MSSMVVIKYFILTLVCCGISLTSSSLVYPLKRIISATVFISISPVNITKFTYSSWIQLWKLQVQNFGPGAYTHFNFLGASEFISLSQPLTEVPMMKSEINKLTRTFTDKMLSIDPYLEGVNGLHNPLIRGWKNKYCTYQKP